MARPKKEPHERRTELAQARVTEAEMAYIDQQAYLAGLERSDYLRRRALDYQVPAKAETAADPALVSELNRLGLELKAIGNNANQLAVNLHTGRRSERLAWEEVVAEITRARAEVAEVLERILGS